MSLEALVEVIQNFQTFLFLREIELVTDHGVVGLDPCQPTPLSPDKGIVVCPIKKLSLFSSGLVISNDHTNSN